MFALSNKICFSLPFKIYPYSFGLLSKPLTIKVNGKFNKFREILIQKDKVLGFSQKHISIKKPRKYDIL